MGGLILDTETKFMDQVTTQGLGWDPHIETVRDGRHQVVISGKREDGMDLLLLQVVLGVKEEILEVTQGHGLLTRLGDNTVDIQETLKDTELKVAVMEVQDGHLEAASTAKGGNE